MALLPSPPLQDSIVEIDQTNTQRRDPFYVAQAWVVWILNSLIPRVQTATQVLKTQSLANQSAAIGATPLVGLPVLDAGFYRVGYMVAKTIADGVSSSVTVTLGFTTDGVSRTLSGSALTLDATTAVQSGEILARLDRSTSVTYATAYASNTPAKMRYTLDLAIEALQ